MIIGKFLDPRAPSLPQQVGINTDDIAEILQENEEQSANIQQNTDDIELLKQQVSESGTRVRVDGELVAEWSPDELTDDLQQLRLAQSSDSLAIVGLQSDNITNKNNIANLEAKTLKTPISPPANVEIVGIGTNNSQINLGVSGGISVKNNNIVIDDAIKLNNSNIAIYGSETIINIPLNTIQQFRFLVINIAHYSGSALIGKETGVLKVSDLIIDSESYNDFNTITFYNKSQASVGCLNIRFFNNYIETNVVFANPYLSENKLALPENGIFITDIWGVK